MNILLLSMPDSFEHTSVITMRMPNGALGVAGRQPRPAPPGLDRRSRSSSTAACAPPSSGWSRTLRAGRRRALGDDVPAPHGAARRRPGPPAASAGDDRRRRLRSEPGARGLRGSRVGRRRDRQGRRRHHVPRAGSRARGRDAALGIDGLSFRDGDTFRRTPPRAVSSLAGEDVRLPNRAARVLSGYTFIGRPIDVVETSRGCTFDCSFCSIIEMRGPELPYLVDRARAARTSAMRARAAPARSSSSTTTSR